MNISERVKKQYEKYPFPKEYDDISFNIDFFTKRIESLNLVGKTVLDVGCGTGLYSFAFAKLGFKVKAIDFSKNSIETAKKRAKELDLDIDFKQTDLFKYEDRKKYDVVFCWGVLHHTKEAEKGFNRLTEFVNPKGFLVINIFNKNYYNMRFARWLAKQSDKKIDKRLEFVKKHKKLFLFIDFLWRYKNHLDMGDNTLVDLFCHEHAKYFSKMKILSWFGLKGFEVLNNDGFFQETYIGQKIGGFKTKRKQQPQIIKRRRSK